MVLDSSSDGYILFGDRIHKTDIIFIRKRWEKPYMHTGH